MHSKYKPGFRDQESYHTILDISFDTRYLYIAQVSSDWSLIHSIYRSIAIPPSIDIERSQVSRYISSIEPALLPTVLKSSESLSSFRKISRHIFSHFYSKSSAAPVFFYASCFTYGALFSPGPRRFRRYFYCYYCCLLCSADDDNDDLFDEPTPNRYSQNKDATEDYCDNYTSVERTRSSASMNEETSPSRRTRRAKPIDIGAAASYGKDSKVCGDRDDIVNVIYVTSYRVVGPDLALESVHSDTNLTSLGNVQPLCILHEDYLFTHISTAVYSQVLIYTAEWTEALWRERKCPCYETAAKVIRNQALGWEPDIIQLSWAPHY